MLCLTKQPENYSQGCIRLPQRFLLHVFLLSSFPHILPFATLLSPFYLYCHPCSVFGTYAPCLRFVTGHICACPLKPFIVSSGTLESSVALQSTHDQVQISQLNFQAPCHQGTCFYSTAVPLILQVSASLQICLSPSLWPCHFCVIYISSLFSCDYPVKLSCKVHLLDALLYFFILFAITLLSELPCLQPL